MGVTILYFVLQGVGVSGGDVRDSKGGWGLGRAKNA